MGSTMSLETITKGIEKALLDVERKFNQTHKCAKCECCMQFTPTNFSYNDRDLCWNATYLEAQNGWVYTHGIPDPRKIYCPKCAKEIGLRD